MPVLGIVRTSLVCLAVLASMMFQSDGCGYEPDPLKGVGEPCTRSTECQSDLSCRGGVCRAPEPVFDAGPPPTFDAGGRDAGRDAGDPDAGDPDAGDLDAGDLDAGGDAGDPDAASDGGDAGLDGG